MQALIAVSAATEVIAFRRNYIWATSPRCVGVVSDEGPAVGAVEDGSAENPGSLNYYR